MTHPCPAIRLLPIGIRGVAFRSTPARFIGDRMSGSIEGHCNSVIVVHTCHNPAAGPLEKDIRGIRGIISRDRLTQSTVEFRQI